MATSAEPVDLDVLPAFDDVDPAASATEGTPAARRPANARRRRWPWAVVAVVIVAAVVAFPVRARLSVAQLDRLDRRWQQAQALDRQRAALISELETAATTADSARMAQAETALDDEEADNVDDLRQAIGAERLVDPSLHRLATAEQAALTAQSRALRAHAVAFLDPAGVVDRQLERLRGRWHRTPARPPRSTARLTAADATLATLQRWTDTPTGAVLIAPADGRLVAVDIDQSRVTPIEPAVTAESVITRTGYLVVVDDRAASVVTLDGTHATSTRRVGTADYVFPAARPDAFWMVDNAPVPGSAGVTRDVAVEVDGQGDQLARWVGAGSIGGPAQITEEPVAEVGHGLLVQRTGAVGRPNLQIMRLDGSPGPALTGVGFPFSASADSVAWVDNATPEHQLHVWDAATATDRVIPNPLGRRIADVGDFSPDGSRLAAAYGVVTGGDDLVQSAVVDITGPAAGAVQILPGAGTLRLMSSAWSPDGRRLFFAGRGPHPLATYQEGDTAVDLLRAHDLSLDRFAVVAGTTPPPSGTDRSTELFGGSVHLRLRDYRD